MKIRERLKYFFRQEFFRDSLALWLLGGALFLHICGWVALALFIRPVGYLIVLQYNVYFGVSLFGRWFEIYIIPATAAVMMLANFFIALRLYNSQEKAAAYMLLLATAILQVSTLIASGSLIYMNY